jgi:DNA-binding NtrC family response regulator
VRIHNVLIVDPDGQESTQTLTRLFEVSNDDLFPMSTTSVSEAHRLLSTFQFHAVVIGLDLTHQSEIGTLTELEKSFPTVAFVVCARTGNESVAYTAMLLGAQDFFTKDELDAEGLRQVVLKAIARKKYELSVRKSMRHLGELSAGMVVSPHPTGAPIT